MKLKPKVDRKPKGWKITSIRIPFETAQRVETMGLKAKVRSATETIIQILESVTAEVRAWPAKKLAWAKKPDASARKQYVAKAKAAPKKAKRKAKAKAAAPRKAKAKAATPKKQAKKIAAKPKAAHAALKAPKAEHHETNGASRAEQHEEAVASA